MKRFLTATLIFIVCLNITAFLTGFSLWLLDAIPFLDIGKSLFSMSGDSASSPVYWGNLFSAILWTVTIIYVIIPVVSAPLNAILPIASSYKDTYPARFLRYLSLCLFLLLLPAFLFVLLCMSWDFFARLMLVLIVDAPPAEAWKMVADANSKQRFHATLAGLVLIQTGMFWGSLIFFGICHDLIAKSAKPFVRWCALRDRGNAGKGGSGRFANMVEEIEQKYTGEKTSLYFGNSMFMPWMRVGGRDDRHMITFAGTRAGKGTTCIIPNLLAWTGSVFCIDPKGVNYAVTKKQRSKYGTVHAFDPFRVAGEETASFNPFAEIDITKDTALDAIRAIAQAIIPDEKGESGEYWGRESRAIFTGYTAYVLTNKIAYPNPNLIDVFNIIMTKTDAERDEIHAIMSLDTSLLCAEMRATANRIKQGHKSDTREFATVMSSLYSGIRWLGSPSMQRVLKTSSFSFKDMGKKPTSIYLIMPPDETDGEYAKLQRLFITTAMKTLRKQGRAPVPCLFMVDETYSLGYFPELLHAHGYLAGTNVMIWTFWQNMGQLNSLYKNGAGTFIANCRAVQCFGGLDDEGKRYIQENLGKRLVSRSINPLANTPTTQYLREIPEITQEIGGYSGQSYIIREGRPTFLLRRIKYYESHYWAKMASPDPEYPNTNKLLFVQIEDFAEKYPWVFLPILFVIGILAVTIWENFIK